MVGRVGIFQIQICCRSQESFVGCSGCNGCPPGAGKNIFSAPTALAKSFLRWPLDNMPAFGRSTSFKKFPIQHGGLPQCRIGKFFMQIQIMLYPADLSGVPQQSWQSQRYSRHIGNDHQTDQQNA